MRWPKDEGGENACETMTAVADKCRSSGANARGGRPFAASVLGPGAAARRAVCSQMVGRIAAVAEPDEAPHRYKHSGSCRDEGGGGSPISCPALGVTDGTARVHHSGTSNLGAANMGIDS